MIAVNVFGIPRWGYMACAWGGFAGYATAMLLSWFIGQRKYPVKYDMRTILGFFALTLVIFFAYRALGRTSLAGDGSTLGAWPLMAVGTLMLALYCVFIWKSLRQSARV